MLPETRYAKTPDGVHVAYAVMGSGPPLVLCPTFIWSIEWAMEDPACSHFLDRLSEFARVIIFDKRGTGRSDPIVGAPTLEERVADVEAVMDAALVDRTVLFGMSEGGAMAILFAATHPERTAGLMTWSTFIRTVGAPEDNADPFVGPPEFIDVWVSTIADSWGRVPDNPGQRTDAAEIRSNVRRQQLSASPAMAEKLARLNAAIDIRAIIRSVKVPTVVMCRTGEALIRPDHSRYIAEKIEDARLIEFPGEDHYPWLGDYEQAMVEIQEFVTGVRPRASHDRVLSTVLMTDLVGSTGHASQIGDRKWRDLLDQHMRIARQQIERNRGQYVQSTGDGVVARFDGPSRAVRCARAIVESVADIGLEARAGVHTGEIELIGNDIGGIAVHIAERIAGLAGAKEVLVSSTVKDLCVGAGIAFDDRGEHELRGIPDRWRVFVAKTT